MSECSASAHTHEQHTQTKKTDNTTHKSKKTEIKTHKQKTRRIKTKM